MSIFLYACGYGLIAFNYPLFARELGAGTLETGFIYSFSSFVTAVAALIGGYMSHRVELKKLILAGNALIIPASVIYTFASDWRWLFAAEFLIGASFVIAPAIYYYTYLRTAHGAHGKSFGVMSVAFPLGMAFMPAIGGRLADLYGLRAPFYGCLAFYVLSCLVLLWLEELKPEPLANRGTLTERLRAFLGEKSLLGILALFGALIFLEGVYTPFLPVYLKSIEGIGYASVGLVASVMFAVNAVATPIAGHAADIYGVRRVLGVTLLVFGSALALMSRTTDFAFILALAVLDGAFRHMYLMNSVATSKSIKNVPVGVAYGLMSFSRSALYTLGPTAGGALARASTALAVFVPGVAYGLIGISILAVDLGRSRQSNKLAVD